MISSADDVVVFAYPDEADAQLSRTVQAELGQHPRLQLASLWLPSAPAIGTLSTWLHEQLSDLPWHAQLHLVGSSSMGIVVRHYAQTHRDDRLVQTLSIGSSFAASGDSAGVDEQAGSFAELTELALGARRALAVPHLSIVAGGDADTESAARQRALSGCDVAVLRNCTTAELPLRTATARIIVARVLDHCSSYGLRSA